MQYESVATCVVILGMRDFGSWDEVWGDNVVCRFLHVGLTLMRPEVSLLGLVSHCSDHYVLRWLRPS